MSDFDTRPQGTVMYGAFNAFAAAERALRVLKNAGYARAAFEGADREREHDEPTVVVVDAAKTGAVRAAEILEEFGAQIHFTPPQFALPVERLTERVVILEQGVSIEPAVAAPLHVTSSPERKPRVRKRARMQPLQPNEQGETSEAPAREHVIIVTRTIETSANDG